MNLGIQTAFASNVSASSTASVPGSGSSIGTSGGTATATFFSAYALSVSQFSANGVRSSELSSENNLTKIKPNAKAAPAASTLTANTKAAPKGESSLTTPATGGAPVAITIPATTPSLPSATTLATVPEVSSAVSVAQGSLAEVSGTSLSQSSVSQGSTPQSSTHGLSTTQASTPKQLVTASKSGDNQLSCDLTPTQSSNPALNLAFAEPDQEGLASGAAAPTGPAQKSMNGNAQSSAAGPSSPSSIGAPLQNAVAAPASSTFVNVIPGKVAPEGCAAPALVSSAANPQSLRESVAEVQRIASGDISAVRTPLASVTGNPAVGFTAPHALENASSKSPTGAAGSVSQLHLSSNNASAVTSSSSTTGVSSSSTTPVATGIPAAASASPNSNGNQNSASAERSQSPESIKPASGAQGKDSGSSDAAAGQSAAGATGTGVSGAGQSGSDQSGTDQSSRKDLTAVATQATGAQPILPQLAATAVPGDAAAQAGTSPAASPAPKSDAALPAAPDSSSSSPTPTMRESPLAPAVGPVQMAQMVSRAAQSEMRIGLITSAFGNVEVHTQIRANDVGLSIGSERGDLHSLLANELPGVANRLQEQSLRLSQVNFHETSAFSGGSSSGGNPQRRFFTQPATAPSPMTETASETFPVPGTTESPRSRHAGLSVLA